MNSINHENLLQNYLIEIQKTKETFTNKLKATLAFAIVSQSSFEGMGHLFEIVDKIKESNIENIDVNRHQFFLEDHSMYFRGLLDLNIMYVDILNEKAIVDQYSAIEELLFQCYFVIFKYFPSFLVKNEFDSIESTYASLFQNDNIEFVRSQIIEKRIKSYLQADNIVNSILKFERLFKFKFNLTQLEKNGLFKFSQIRNVIIHNNSTINSIFIQGMKSKSLEHNFSIGDKIHQEMDKWIIHYTKFLEKLGVRMLEIIIADDKRVLNYYLSKYE